jgi:hypothetical protein
MASRARCATAAVAACALVAAGALAGCGGGDETTTTTASHTSGGGSDGISNAEKQAATRRLERALGKGSVKKLKQGRGLAGTSIRPAEIVPGGGPGPFFSSDVIYPQTNGWQAGDKQTYTAVDAGANPANPSMGELGIFREDHVKVAQSQKVVDVPNAGAVRIVKAPTGAAVATSAQRDGELVFVGRNGVRGTLHLSDDSVTIERQGASQAS